MKYFDIRKNYLSMHNKEVSNQVEMDSDLIRNMTKGHPVIVCQECGEDIAWGNIRNHRRGGPGGCVHSLLNFDESDD